MDSYKEYLRTWLDGIYSEIQFWENVVMKEDGDLHDKVMSRMIVNDKFTLESDLEDLECNEVKFVDVGSGPFSRCGFRSDKYKIETIAVDPLASIYSSLKDKYGMNNQIHLRTGFVETLHEQFDEDEFDIVHMSNSLDHAFDAVFGLYELLYICKIGGKVILCHHENEAENENYSGFHQWNLSVHNQENSFVIWRKNKRFNVCEKFGEYADITVCPDQIEKENGWKYNKIVLRKKEKIAIPKNKYREVLFNEIYDFLLGLLSEENTKRNKLQLQNEFSRKVRERIEELRITPDDFYRLMIKRGYKRIDIYGAGKIGRDLYTLCIESGIYVRTLIDRSKSTYGLLPVVLADQYAYCDEVDAVISTIGKKMEISIPTKTSKVDYIEDILFHKVDSDGANKNEY